MLIYSLAFFNFISIIISIPETEFIPTLFKHLYINNCIILKDQIGETNLEISFTKYLSKYNIQTVYMSFDGLNATTYQHYILKINAPRLFIILDVKTINDTILAIFNLDNEPLLKNYIWAIFDVDDFSIQLENIYIPYNCQFFNIKTISNNIYEIFEIYHMKIFTRNICKIFYGRWEKNNGITVINPDFYGRRFDLNHTIFPAVEDFKPAMSEHPAILAYEDIVKDMGKMMNFRPIFISFNTFSELWESGTIGMYEFSIGLFVLHSDAYYYDIIGPIWKAPAFFHIAYNKKYEQGYSSPHTKPLNEDVWITIVIWILISGLCITFIKYLLHKKSIENPLGLINYFFMPFDSFTNQWGSELPKEISTRIAIIMTRLAPLLITSAYSAAVLSFVTVKLIDLPFKDLRGLVEDGTFKIGFENGTFSHSFFRKSNDPVARTVLKKFTIGLDKMPITGQEGIKKMCEDPKFAFLFFNNDIFRMEKQCEILQIPSPIVVTWDGFSLRDFSPYTRIFNRVLKTFFSAGILSKMEKTVYGKKPVVKIDDEPDPVRLESVIPLLKFISLLYLTSLLILFIECARYLIKKK